MPRQKMSPAPVPEGTGLSPPGRLGQPGLPCLSESWHQGASPFRLTLSGRAPLRTGCFPLGTDLSPYCFIFFFLLYYFNYIIMCFMHNIQKIQTSQSEEASGLTGEPAPEAGCRVLSPPGPHRGLWSRSPPFSSNQHEARFTLTAACYYPSAIN